MADEQQRQDLLAPEERQRVAEVSGQVTAVVEEANALQVRTQEEAEAAASFLTNVATMKREAEKARKYLVDPLNAHVKAINALFKPNETTLAAADKAVRGKVTEFRAEQDRLRRQEQARLEAEQQQREREADERRRAAEAEAQRAREAAAREAAAAEEAARRVERERLEASQRDQASREARIAALSEAQLDRLAGVDSDDGRTAKRELEARASHRRAQEAAARAQQAEAEAREAEAAARATPAEDVLPIVAAPAVRLAGVAERKRWVFEVTDASKVPDRFKVVDERLIRQAVKEGARSIPGVNIHEASELAVRAS